jgi:predicted nucleic acid-binding protein
LNGQLPRESAALSPRRFENGVPIPFADGQTTHHYAGVFRQIRKQGTSTPTNDMWLASLVVQHNLALRARDEHLDHLQQMARV